MSNNNKAVWKELERQGLANVEAVEIKTSAPDSGAWYESKELGRNVFVRDRQFRPTIDATIHGKDGSRKSRQIKSPKSYYGNQQRAKQIADEEAQTMWKVAKDKNIPVIMKTGTHKQHANITKNAAYLKWEHEYNKRITEDAYMESPKGRIQFVLFSVVVMALPLFACYGITILSAWLGL